MASATARRFLDLAERTALTYVASVAGLLAVDTTGSLSLGTVRVALVSAAPAAVTAIKSAFTLAFGSSGTASLLPAPKAAADTPAVTDTATAPAAG